MIYKALISALAFLILSYFAFNWHQENICCPTADKGTEKVSTEKTEKAAKAGPLVFNWDKGQVLTNDLWPTKKRGVMEKKDLSDQLHIIGGYYKDEKNTTSYENLGVARAEATKKLMVDVISPADIITSGKELLGSVSDRKAPLEVVEFEWQTKPVEVDSATVEVDSTAVVEEIKPEQNENVVVLDDEILLRFPYKSTEKINNKNINDYLVKLAAELKTNDKKVELVGHTDNIGQNKYNEKLGLERSKAVKKILEDMGISPDRITATSKGELEPIETNDTEEGRQANRRVSLKVK